MSSSNDMELQEIFLRKIRQAVSPASESPRVKSDFPEVFASTDDRRVFQNICSRTALDYQGLIHEFIENGKALNLHVHTAKSFEVAAQIITDIACSSDPEFGSAKHVIQHDHPDIVRLQLWKDFSGKEIALHTTYPDDPDLREKTICSYIGITAADWGIAESSTLVQHTAAGRPRSTSLVPSIHVGLLSQGRLLANLEEAYCMIRRSSDLTSSTFISGPSKTADIEAHMVHGAHGPREMHVIILVDQIAV